MTDTQKLFRIYAGDSGIQVMAILAVPVVDRRRPW